MTQTFSQQDMATLSPQQMQKQQKKQMKREAKMMRKVGKAKRKLQKAEMQMARAHLSQEIANTRLRTYEDELNKMRGNNSK